MIPIMHCISSKSGRVALLLHLFCAASKQIQIIQNNSTKSTRVTYLCTLELFDVWFDWHCFAQAQLICNQKNYIVHCNLMTHSKCPKIVNIQKSSAVSEDSHRLHCRMQCSFAHLKFCPTIAIRRVGGRDAIKHLVGIGCNHTTEQSVIECTVDWKYFETL